MAESKRETQSPGADFADDLDSMLDDAAGETREALLDDQDALDKLLEQQQEATTAPEMDVIDEFDEFSDDPAVFDNNSPAPADEADKPAETSADDLDQEDFTIPEFDIAEEDFLEDPLENEVLESSAIDPEPEPEPAPPPQPDVNAALKTQLDALEVNQKALAGQLEQLIEQNKQKDQESQQMLAGLEQKHASMQKQLEQAKKPSTLPAIGIGVAALAAILALVAVILVFKNQSRIDDLLQLTASLEETQSAIDPEQFNARQKQQGEQLAGLEQHLEELNTQLNKLEQLNEQSQQIEAPP